MKQLILTLTAYCSFAAIGVLASETPINFNRDIRPILTENCFKCHGFDKAARKGGLRLDDRDAAMLPAKSEKRAIVPGKIDESELVRRITTTVDEDQMPPTESGKKLKPEQTATLKRWVAEGAAFSKHWSFEKPVKAPLPTVATSGWTKNEIDFFVLQKIESEKLNPSPEAAKFTLARRAALDLTGLPPAADALKSFMADSSPNAFEKYVDVLLASPAYGERWARVWLDLARFADTKGYEKDLRRTIWPWRDWVINAYNADMPYDRFTREQLAGDLLEKPTPEQLVATGFHRNTMTNEEGGVDHEEFRMHAVRDRVDTTVQVWMGLSMGCAKCHTHKYDPITINDYYSFYAFFNQTEDANRGDEQPTLTTPSRAETERIATLDAAIASAELKLKETSPEIEAALPEWEKEIKEHLGWRTIHPKSSKAASGSALVQQSDGSILAKNKEKSSGPAKEQYTLTFDAPQLDLTGLRIEALPDASHPRGGVGRSKDDGNFVLTGIKLSAKSADGKDEEIAFSKAVADFAQQDYPIEHVLKNPDPKKHGWAVSPKLTEPHMAVFTLAAPLKLAQGRELTLTLDHSFEYSHPGFSMGKFRIALTNDAAPGLSPSVPDEILKIIAIAPDVRSAEQKRALLNHFASVCPQHKSVRDEIAKLKGERAGVKPVATPILRELAEKKRRVTKVLNRGNFLDQTEVVDASVPSALHAWPNGLPKNRLGLAQWICSPENPLTARVAVNRVWAQMFGAGIVETLEDFGSQGAPPSHPELLDWLAVDFMENGWSFKKLIKKIALSATYRQSARASAELAKRDRFNRLLARGPRFRMEAEMLRDQALAVSGLLSSKMFGPSVMPYQPPGLWKSTYSNDDWVTSPGEDRYRRGLYTFLKRTTPYPEAILFDATSRETCTLRRPRTNTPLQALITLNDPVFVECAQALARKMALKGGEKLDGQIAFGLREALLREPRAEEISELAGLYRRRIEEGKADKTAMEKLATDPLGPLPAGMDAAHAAALTAVANVILNLDEFVTK